MSGSVPSPDTKNNDVATTLAIVKGARPQWGVLPNRNTSSEFVRQYLCGVLALAWVADPTLRPSAAIIKLNLLHAYDQCKFHPKSPNTLLILWAT